MNNGRVNEKAVERAHEELYMLPEARGLFLYIDRATFSSFLYSKN